MSIAEKIKEMEEIASYASDEYFDYITDLCTMYSYFKDVMSTQMLQALLKELEDEYDNIKENTRVVEEVKTVSVKNYCVEWIS